MSHKSRIIQIIFFSIYENNADLTIDGKFDFVIRVLVMVYAYSQNKSAVNKMSQKDDTFTVLWIYSIIHHIHTIRYLLIYWVNVSFYLKITSMNDRSANI